MGKLTGHPLITVGEKHISCAIPENSAKCMIAEAIRDSIPGSKKIHVDMQTIRFTDDKDVRRTYLTPAGPQAALVRFDAGDPVMPFAFRLPSVMHFSKPSAGTKAAETRGQQTEVTRMSTSHPRARVGGKRIPLMGSGTRRRFGIRNLRINQQGQVEQIGTLPPSE